MYAKLLFVCILASQTALSAKPLPIQFSISEEKIVDSIPEKRRDFATLIPAQTNTYLFNQEEEYRNGYQESYFAITCKKGGWDCMRHYEILANGCIPYFIRLEQCNPNTMKFLPRNLILEAMNLPGVPKIDTHDPRTIQSSHLKIDHSIFDKKRYFEILNELLEYTRQQLTTKNMAQYLLNELDYKGNGKILYLSKDISPDYLRGCMLIGLKQLYADRIVDFPKIPHIYKSYPHDIKKLYGKGFSYTRLIEDHHIDRSNIENRIKNKEFDIIIYGSVHRGLLYHNVVKAHYKPEQIIYICGEDAHRCQYSKWKNLFLREFDAYAH